jgi:hypothetical protein
VREEIERERKRRKELADPSNKIIQSLMKNDAARGRSPSSETGHGDQSTSQIQEEDAPSPQTLIKESFASSVQETFAQQGSDWSEQVPNNPPEIDVQSILSFIQSHKNSNSLSFEEKYFLLSGVKYTHDS